MIKFMSLIERFSRDETGATAIEYAIIAGLIMVAIVSAVTTVGTNTNANFESYDDTLSAAQG